ncbi:MAG: hypothetical protein IBX72_16010 [Nitrospirae bacterium]|nr:hypothetical protein [Nitrospirota bacterium]
MSAIADNILERLRKEDPAFVRAMEVVTEAVIKFHKALGIDDYQPGEPIIRLEDMTDEEVEIQYIERFLKDGLSLEESTKKAKEDMIITEEIFAKLDAQEEIKKVRLLN